MTKRQRLLAAAAEVPDESAHLPSGLGKTPSLPERVQAQREQLFKAISIVQCCRNATATKMLTDDLEYMIPAFEAVCELLDRAADEFDRIAHDCD